MRFMIDFVGNHFEVIFIICASIGIAIYRLRDILPLSTGVFQKAKNKISNIRKKNNIK